MEKPLISSLIKCLAFWFVLHVRRVYLAVVKMLRWPRIFWTSSKSTPASIRWVA